jgi:hypothetical protein
VKRQKYLKIFSIRLTNLYKFEKEKKKKKKQTNKTKNRGYDLLSLAMIMDK